METEKGIQEEILKPKKFNFRRILVAASVLFLLGIGVFGYINYMDFNQNEDLGTYDDPEVAFKETQKALSILSKHLKIGIENVQYIKEYENSKNLIFKKQKSK